MRFSKLEAFYGTSLTDIDRYYRYSAFWIHRIVDPRVRQYANLRRDFIVQSYYNSILHGWGDWSSAVFTGDCGAPERIEPRVTVADLLIKNAKLNTYPEPTAMPLADRLVEGGIGRSTRLRPSETYVPGRCEATSALACAKEATISLRSADRRCEQVAGSRSGVALKAGSSSKTRSGVFSSKQDGASRYGVEAPPPRGEIVTKRRHHPVGPSRGQNHGQSGAKVSARDPRASGRNVLDYLDESENHASCSSSCCFLIGPWAGHSERARRCARPALRRPVDASPRMSRRASGRSGGVPTLRTVRRVRKGLVGDRSSL